jgi:hypothetical protein
MLLSIGNSLSSVPRLVDLQSIERSLPFSPGLSHKLQDLPAAVSVCNMTDTFFAKY